MGKHEVGYERVDKDAYNTPPWVIEALAEHIDLAGLDVWEPAAGNGQMVEALKAAGAMVHATDICVYDSYKLDRILDFTTGMHRAKAFDAIISNPPFGLRAKLAEEFVEVGLQHIERDGGFLALLLPTDFDSAKTRSHFFRDCRHFAGKIVLTKRITWFDPPPGEKRKSPKENHAWYTWRRSIRRGRQPVIMYAPRAGGVGMSARSKKRTAAAQRHNPQFLALAQRLTPADVKVVFHKGNFGRARSWERKIFVPYLTTVERLKIYLHELGHLVHQNEDNSESEYLAEAYAFRAMRRAGISLSRENENRKNGIAYVGAHIINDVLLDRAVSAKALAFVGLKNVHPVTIGRAHDAAVTHIGYTPKWVRIGNTMAPPPDTGYWTAVLAAAPAATPTAAEIKRYEWKQQVEREREERMIGNGDYYGD